MALGSTIFQNLRFLRRTDLALAMTQPQFVMDVTLANPYMRRHTMNWLLVLSALFSTLTGVTVGARPLAAVVQQSALATAIRQHAATAAPQARAHGHLLGAFGVRPVLALVPSLVRATAARVPLYLGRLRV